MTRVIRNTRAFTLIESLISIILLSICLAGGLSFYFNASEIMALATHKRIAMEMANQRMEELIKEDYDNELLDITDWKPEALDPESFQGFKSVLQRRIIEIENPPDPPYKQVEVRVCWPETCDNKKSKQLFLATYKTDEKI